MIPQSPEFLLAGCRTLYQETDPVFYPGFGASWICNFRKVAVCFWTSVFLSGKWKKVGRVISKVHLRGKKWLPAVAQARGWEFGSMMGTWEWPFSPCFRVCDTQGWQPRRPQDSWLQGGRKVPTSRCLFRPALQRFVTPSTKRVVLSLRFDWN